MPLRWDEPTPPNTSAPLDPYYLWAERTNFRGMSSHAGWQRSGEQEPRVQIIAKASDQQALDQVWTHAQGADAKLQIPPSYRQPIPGTSQRALHFTAWIRKADLAWLAGSGLKLRWELSQPRRDAERLSRGAAMGYFGPTLDPADLRAPNVLAEAIAAAKDQPDDSGPLRDVIAVIDFGCPFLNDQFCVAGHPHRTRVVSVWDQGSQVPSEDDGRFGAKDWPWSTPADQGYGRELSNTMLQAMRGAMHPVATPTDRRVPAIEESAAYRGIDYLIDYDDPRRRVWLATHGTHVLDVAGGTVDPLRGEEDAASQAQLMFVQLPSLTSTDSSGASLGSHLLDGLRYVLSRCAANARLVVTISYGSHGGPHDGTSLIESAMEELLQARQNNFAIVLASGNSRQKRCHARHEIRPTRTALLRCAISAADTTDTFVETWYGPPPAGWVLKARACAPNRLWSDWVLPGAELAMRDIASNHEVVAWLRNDSSVPNAGRSGLVLLGLGPTEAPVDLPCATAEPGLWQIELALMPVGKASGKAREVAPTLEVQSRIQRDDPGQNLGSGEHFFLQQTFDDELDTLSSIASGASTIAVGGFRLSNRQQTAYTSVGPRRGPSAALPLVLAACEEDEINPNIRATAVRSGEVFRMNGTSVAAPVLARQLFNAMARRRVPRNGWKAVLDRLAQVPDGVVRWPAR